MLGDGSNGDVKDGRENEAEEGAAGHAEEDGGADRLPTCGAGAGGAYQGENAEDEGEGGHEYRPQSEAGGFDYSVDDSAAFFAVGLCEFDDQDRVFCAQADDENEANLGIDVVIHA